MPEPAIKRKMPALEIIKALPNYADELSPTGIAVMVALCSQWDNLRCERAVCWSNRMLARRSGISRNSVDKIRTKLIEQGWIVYAQDGRTAGHYTPKMPHWALELAQSGDTDCANRVTMTVQVMHKLGTTTVQIGVTYNPILSLPNLVLGDGAGKQAPASPPHGPNLKLPHFQELRQLGCVVTKGNATDWDAVIQNYGMSELHRCMKLWQPDDGEKWPNRVVSFIEAHPKIKRGWD